MGIGRKITILHVFLIVMFVTVVFVVGQIWRVNYLKHEQEEVKDNTTRAYLAWDGELEVLESLVADWSPRDDLYVFSQQSSGSDFVEKNLTDAAMANLKINMAIVTDPQGNIIFAKAIDLAQKTETPVAGEIAAHIQKIPSLLPAENQEAAIKGFVMLPKFPAFIAAQRILTSEKNGPSPGILIFVRNADDDYFTSLAKRTRVNIAFSADSGDKQQLSAADNYHQEIVDETTIKGYHALLDLYGKNNYFLVSTMPRDIYLQGQRLTYTFISIALTFGLLSVIITLYLLRKIMLDRLLKIDDFMKSVTMNNDYSARLDLSGNDELSRIATTMNNMLTRIQNSQTRITKLYESGQQELEQRKKVENAFTRLSLRDSLTGVYNRAYFEHELKRLNKSRNTKLGIICCDVNGLKIINDTLGHSIGDEMLVQSARILTDVFKGKGTVARIGGDEFAVLLTGVDEPYIHLAGQQIKELAEQVKPTVSGIQLSLSIGWKYSENVRLTEEVLRNLLREADDVMYRQKLSNSQSNRNALVQAMMTMLESRDFITEGHSRRLLEFVSALGQAIGLSEERLTDLRILAQFHDIGKVGISDQILFKPGPLADEERKTMERHSQIGHRIAQVIPELLPIADLILKHHEWWNGQGYPIGLQGDSIPVENRILAIADAYDAMTSDRPYRKAMSQEAALEELKRFSGIQFEPSLVDKFIAIINQKQQ